MDAHGAPFHYPSVSERGSVVTDTEEGDLSVRTSSFSSGSIILDDYDDHIPPESPVFRLPAGSRDYPPVFHVPAYNDAYTPRGAPESPVFRLPANAGNFPPVFRIPAYEDDDETTIAPPPPPSAPPNGPAVYLGQPETRPGSVDDAVEKSRKKRTLCIRLLTSIFVTVIVALIVAAVVAKINQQNSQDGEHADEADLSVSTTVMAEAALETESLKGQRTATTTTIPTAIPSWTSSPSSQGQDYESFTVDCACYNEHASMAATQTIPEERVSKPTCRARPGSHDDEQALANAEVVGMSVVAFRNCLMVKTTYGGANRDLMYKCTVSCAGVGRRDEKAGDTSVGDWILDAG